MKSPATRLGLFLVVALACFLSGYWLRGIRLQSDRAKNSSDSISDLESRPPGDTSVTDGEFVVASQCLQVYGVNSWSWDKYTSLYVPVASEVSMGDKLKLLSRLLSSYCFKGLPIDVLSVEDRDGAPMDNEWDHVSMHRIKYRFERSSR
jgi:hypothetical protein